ncbi:hypothetical protein [Actinomadura sp. CNU-125]|uniref:hypothetical protein n=1 Tax=Actinomadura sp. CNU-125 TaxID=1904961 RepID=UPI000AB18D4F|nr:hypothetical protein [Actinomadura sp. CNU-125]
MIVLITGVLAAGLVWVVPGAARWRGPWTVVGQAALASAAVVAGTSVGVLGFVAAALPLVDGRRDRRSVVRALPLVAGAAAIEAGRDGASAAADGAITVTLMGLVGYGLVRLAERVDDTAAARLPLTMAAVERERLRIAPS